MRFVSYHVVYPSPMLVHVSASGSVLPAKCFLHRLSIILRITVHTTTHQEQKPMTNCRKGLWVHFLPLLLVFGAVHEKHFARFCALAYCISLHETLQVTFSTLLIPTCTCRRVKGRLKLCSGSLIFDAEDVKLPIVKLPFKFVIAIDNWKANLLSTC